VYSDGTNITSFPVEFKSPGEQVGNFSFRVEREGKHHLEFVILTSGELQEKQFENNRMSVTFEVPGPGRGVVTAPVSTVSKPEAVPFPPTVADSVKEDEGEDRGLNQEDAADYLEQPELDYEENVVPPELMTKVFSSGKPLVDVFFSGNDALKLKKSNLKDSRAISWELVVQSNGTGEGEIEIVVADGNKKIITQHVWLRGGETLHIPMQATFDRSGPHRLTAMINTQNNIVDRNMENNILEQTIQVE
ncbi:MAG: hypothetical protein HZC17_02755, partial [Candidatus Omnitrophica bacterium]|nr:hypothetical protein [Candidatus Omnitrophota bacterium]